MNNLVLLCRRHHRLVHEGGFGVHGDSAGAIRFTYPNGRVMATGPDSRFRGNVAAIKVNNRNHGLDINSGTLPPLWRGEKMDHSQAILGLVSRE